MDVGGEWHVADFIENGVEVWRGGEAEDAFTEVFCGQNFSFQKVLRLVGGVEEKVLARLDLAAGADQG
jgi:hypothetical protein